MAKRGATRDRTKPPAVYVVSGGAGTSGEQLVRSALAQFLDVDIPVVTIPNVRSVEQVCEVVAQAGSTGGTIVHTLVNADLRRTLSKRAEDQDTVTIDLIGDVLSHLATVLAAEPVGRPGLYRKLREDYFERVEAIEFAVAHDDGRNPQELAEAEIVLIGVSRVGKTPLTIYLSMLGWKVANVPIVRDIAPPEELFGLDPRRVVGLTIAPSHVRTHRRLRGRRIGVPKKASYTGVTEISEEIATLRRLCRKHGFTVVNVTDKPIEESADEVAELVTRRLEARGR